MSQRLEVHVPECPSFQPRQKRKPPRSPSSVVQHCPAPPAGASSHRLPHCPRRLLLRIEGAKVKHVHVGRSARFPAKDAHHTPWIPSTSATQGYKALIILCEPSPSLSQTIVLAIVPGQRRNRETSASAAGMSDTIFCSITIYRLLSLETRLLSPAAQPAL